MHRTQRFVSAMATLLVFTSLAVARQVRAGDDWLPVPPEDLALKDNPADPGADAMILYRESTLNTSDLNARGDSDQEYVRIKIFTQEGTKYGTVEVDFLGSQPKISFDSYSAGLQVLGVRGRTIHPDGSIVPFDGKVLVKEVQKEGGSKVLAATFSLPDVQPGSIIEYKYNEKGEPGWMHGEEWTVSQDIFTREAHFTFIPPGNFTGYIPAYRVYGLPADEMPKCDVGVNHSCVMTARNIPAVVEEPLMPPRRALEAYVEWFYEDLDASPGESPERYWSSTAKKWSDDLDDFTNKKGALSQEVSQIVSPDDPPEIKLRKIYARVQQIRNLNTEAFKTEKEQKAENLKQNSNVEDVLKHGYGYDREINFLFVGLARTAGFEATEIYLAPRSNGFFLPKLEDAEQLVADIVWVRAGAKEYYLDPAARYFPFGLLPWYETDAGGIRLTKQGGDLVFTPDPVSSDAVLVRHADLDLGDDGAATGKLQVDFTGQRAALLREEKHNEDETGRKKDLEDEIKSWLPAGASFELTTIANWDDTAQPLHIEGIVNVPSFGSAIGRRMIVPVALFQSSSFKAFAPEKRVNAVYFRFPYEELDDLTLRAPVGYKIETLPDAQKINRGAVTYEESAAQQGDGVEAKRHLIVNGLLIPQSSYPALRAFFSLVQTDDNAQIVFQGAESAKSN